MSEAIKILPLALLLVLAVIFIRLGKTTRRDPERNRPDIGGGAGDGGGAD